MQDFTAFRALGLSFKGWFRNFFPITIVAAVLYAPCILYVFTLDVHSLESLDSVNQVMMKAFYYPFFLMSLASTLLPCFLIYRVVQDLNGNKTSMLTSIKLGMRGILPAIVVALVGIVLGFVPFGGIVNIVLVCIWYVAAPAAVAEKITNPFSAMSRSAVLTSGRRWSVFGMQLLVGLAEVAVLFLVIAPAFTHADSFFTEYHHIAIVGIVIIGVVQMFNGIVQATSYALLRQDKEGVGHDDLAKIFE